MSKIITPAMSKGGATMNNRKKKSTNKRSREFRVVVRGHRRTHRDIAKLQRASLDYYLAGQERLAQAERAATDQPHDRERSEDDRDA
jgi:hypothetical protein